MILLKRLNASSKDMEEQFCINYKGALIEIFLSFVDYAMSFATHSSVISLCINVSPFRKIY